MSKRAWRFVGGPDDGQEVGFEPKASDNDIVVDGFTYVVRHHDRILLFHPDSDEMAERSRLLAIERFNAWADTLPPMVHSEPEKRSPTAIDWSGMLADMQRRFGAERAKAGLPPIKLELKRRKRSQGQPE